jgi:hypothetical protein
MILYKNVRIFTLNVAVSASLFYQLAVMALINLSRLRVLSYITLSGERFIILPIGGNGSH